MSAPLVVTGHGRSGTHWLADVLGEFFDARHEESGAGADVVVDCRLVDRMPKLLDEHRVIHLVRDGRDVVRSTFEFYHGGMTFEEACRGWAHAVETMKDCRAVRLEDLTRPRASSGRYRLTHWREWPDDLTDRFWDLCGPQMARHGYER